MILIVVACGVCSAQNSDDGPARGWRLGLFGSWSIVDHDVEMIGLPGIPSCCPGYDGGSGNGYAFGLSVDYPLFPSLRVTGRGIYGTYGGLLEAEEGQLVIAERDTTTATFLHSIDASLSAVGLEGILAYNPVADLFLLGGLRGEFTTSSAFHQEERILEPSSLRFENDSRTRMVFDGSLPDVQGFQVSVLFGFRYDLYLSRDGRWTASPEITGRFGITDVVADRSWRMNGIRFGLTLSRGMVPPGESSPLDPKPGNKWEPEESLPHRPTKAQD